MASFGQQLKALLRRNILLKRRNKASFFMEILYPLAIILVLKNIKKPQGKKPALRFPIYHLNDSIFGFPFIGKSILAVPDTHQVDKWMRDIVAQLTGQPKYKLFPRIDLAEAEYLSNSTNVAAGIIFNFRGDWNSYAIRLDFNSVPSTLGSKYDASSTNGACSDDVNGISSNCRVNKYLTTGFVHLQLAIENVLMATSNITFSGFRNTKVKMMDRAEFSPDTSFIQITSGTYFVFSFFFLAIFMVVSIVEEKEKKIKEGMLMMGLRSSVFWLSWGLFYLALITIVSTLMIIVIVRVQFFKQSSMLLLFLCFLLYGCSNISFAFMITPFFNKASVAASVCSSSIFLGGIIYFAISFIRNSISQDSNVLTAVEWIVCLVSPIPFAIFIEQGMFLDIHMNGFGFNDSLTYGKFPLYAPILMLVVDTILYSLLTVYFDNVIPGEYGVKRHPLYFLQDCYWYPRQQNMETSRLVDPNHDQSQNVDVEPVGKDMENKVAIQISSLTKSFKIDGKLQKAVNEFCLDIYEGQITCLLGHNGAGKTTLINMLTGVIPPTSGNADILGLDITKTSDMNRIRQNCGICLQQNILYDQLSCREHLEMFASIKGVHPSIINKTVTQALSDVDLVSQSEIFAKNISGGQKRKLSVAIALIGDPKLIFLDEPTAGMDPLSRHHLWSLLKRIKKDRMVLLTTHFMDEADILADRKAFIRKGKLCCCGSSLFLKNKFGVGYHLTMVVAPNCDIEKVTSLLKYVIPDIVHQRSHGKEISYTVPLKDLSKFSDLFLMLDEVAEENGIKSYGVSMTTLEEVFLKIEAEEVVNDDDDDNAEEVNGRVADNNDINTDIHASLPVIESIGKSTVDGWALNKQIFWSLMHIHFLLLIRNKTVVYNQIMLPSAMIIFAFVFYKVQQSSVTLISRPLTFTALLYVRPAKVDSTTPALLVMDVVDNADSQALVLNWRNQYAVDKHPVGTSTSSVAPHYLGVQIDYLQRHDQVELVVLYNDSAIHSIPVTINMVTQSILSSSNISINISGNSFPWPSLTVHLLYILLSFIFSILIGLAYTLIVPGLSTNVVKDRECKLRNQLRVSGVTFNLYWGAIYLYDLLIYLIPTVLIIILLLAFQQQIAILISALSSMRPTSVYNCIIITSMNINQLVSSFFFFFSIQHAPLLFKGLSAGDGLCAVILMLITNILLYSVLSLVLSFIFNKAESSTVYLPIPVIIIALFPYLIVIIVESTSGSLASVILHYIVCVIDPPYIIFGGFYFIIKVSLMAFIQQKDTGPGDYFRFDNHVIISIIMPLIHLLWMYWLLRILDVWKADGRIEEALPCFSKFFNSIDDDNADRIQNEDEDVKTERTRIEHLDIVNDKKYMAYISQLRKVYRQRTKSEGILKPGRIKFKVAVRNLSIGIEPGEVLGLLGPNGAGKSTALSMMIADTSPTCGKVIVSGHNVRSKVLSELQVLGYCPQQDVLWEDITLEEHIQCFTAIRGVDPKHIDSVVNFFIDQLKLQEHRKKNAKELSGGTKRKLSYILSILGLPQLVLMDEPSTGMDPLSKRFLWDTISSSFSNTGRGAILTTHYMEDADALCGRVGIMVNGELKCLGSTQHLKNKHGSGYILEVKLANCEAGELDPLMTKLENHLKELFPGLKEVERFQERAQYSIPKEDVTSIGETFTSLEKCKLTHELEEYSFSQCSLEQVFLYFAHQQLKEEEEDLDIDTEDHSKHGQSHGRRNVSHLANTEQPMPV